MRHIPLVLGILLAGSPGAAALQRTSDAVAPQAATAQAGRQTASAVTVRVPNENTELTVNGEAMPGTGTSRVFQTPALDPGVTSTYTFTAEWQPNTYTTMTRSKTVSVKAGEPIEVDLTVEAPGDRVRVIYVPTPADVAVEMVRLAGVTPADVVYEPGCGDARVTIAAIEYGAARGVCIDIQPERVAESLARVTEAGLERRIDVRLGDALDVADLSQATVVFLYMGDHFNLLIRPALRKALPVGARVVSHRFKMGDWEPDRTVLVNSTAGGEYELHLWTITEEVKRSPF